MIFMYSHNTSFQVQDSLFVQLTQEKPRKVSYFCFLRNMHTFLRYSKFQMITRVMDKEDHVHVKTLEKRISQLQVNLCCWNNNSKNPKYQWLKKSIFFVHTASPSQSGKKSFPPTNIQDQVEERLPLTYVSTKRMW